MLLKVLLNLYDLFLIDLVHLLGFLNDKIHLSSFLNCRDLLYCFRRSRRSGLEIQALEKPSVCWREIKNIQRLFLAMNFILNIISTGIYRF